MHFHEISRDVKNTRLFRPLVIGDNGGVQLKAGVMNDTRGRQPRNERSCKVLFDSYMSASARKIIKQVFVSLRFAQGLEIAKVGSEVGLLENWRCTHYKLSVQSRAVNQPKIPHTLSGRARARTNTFFRTSRQYFTTTFRAAAAGAGKY
jgi:hypothetical protein